MTFWREALGGVTVMVKMQPKARQPGLRGERPSASGPRLGIAVTEAAENGKANRAVCATLAEALNIAQSSVQIVSGASSREKLLAVTGDPATLAEKLRRIAGGRNAQERESARLNKRPERFAVSAQTGTASGAL